MRRTTRAFVLIAVMLWQAFSWVTPIAIEMQAERLAHNAMHAEDVGHHHHSDESLHLSADADGASHFHAESGLQPLGLAAMAVDFRLAQLSSAPPGAHVSEPPTVFLDGLLRPPSTQG